MSLLHLDRAVMLFLCGSAIFSPLPRAFADTTQPDLSPAILTPPSPAEPQIHGARLFGVRPGHPVLYSIAATGDRPMSFSADGLPPGLVLDEATGQISGSISVAGSYPLVLRASNSRGAAAKSFTFAVGDKIALTPPMGWNTYYAFRLNINDAMVRREADAMVASGLANHGWSYINLDEGWNIRPNAKSAALNGPGRDADGVINPNRNFPDMKSLCDYIHGKGLKAGIYSSPGPLCCGGSIGSYQHEDQDVQTYAQWGFDYVKYDWCFYSRIAHENQAVEYSKLLPESADQIHLLLAEKTQLEAIRPRTAEHTARIGEIDKTLGTLFAKMDQGQKSRVDLAIAAAPYRLFTSSLQKASRDMVFSFCQYGTNDVWTWGESGGGNAWRTTTDIIDTWPRVSGIGFKQAGLEKFAGPGHWNDPDMLQVGVVSPGRPSRLTPDEQYAHISLWCLLDAPLIIGGDLTKLDPFTLNLLTNDEVLAVNQDALGEQAARIRQTDGTEVWSKSLEDHSLAVGLFNLNDAPHSVSVTWKELGLPGAYVVRDLWRQKNLEAAADRFEALVPAHGVFLMQLLPSKAATQP